MQSKRYPQQTSFWMAIDVYDALQKFFLKDERSMASFLRLAIKKELNSDSVLDINQILTLGHCKKCKKYEKCNRSVNFSMGDNDYHALTEYLINAGFEKATFYRYIAKKELHRLEIEKEKNQTWDIE